MNSDLESGPSISLPNPTAMSFELVVIPVADADRAKGFYASLGWHCDIDFIRADGFRIVQFTPPGSAASIMFGNGITAGKPGSAQGLHLIVSDVDAARSDLIARGVGVSDLFHDGGGIFHRVSGDGLKVGPNPARKSYASYASFKDQDGNGWTIQEVTARLSDLKTDDTRFTPELVKAATSSSV